MQQGAQAQSQDLPLRVVTMQALVSNGVQIIEKPKRFKGYVLDLADADAPTTKVMKSHCDNELMDIFAEAGKVRTSEAIDEAANKATLFLCSERRVIEADAAQTAHEIAFALANYLGIQPSERVISVAIGKGLASNDRSVDTAVGDALLRHDAAKERQSAANTQDNAASTSRKATSTSVLGGATSTDFNAHFSVNTSTVDVSSNNTGVIDPSRLSDDYITREKQIIDSGVGMNWFDLLKCWCLVNAVLICLAIAAVFRFWEINGAWPTAILCGILVSLCICNVVSYKRLTRFKKSGPNMTIGTLFASSFIPFPVFYSVAGMLKSDGVGRMEGVWVAVVFSLMLVTVSYFYLKKRRRFFTL